MSNTSNTNHANPAEFRLLNENEKAVILKAVQKNRLKLSHPLVEAMDYLRVSYECMQGGFCVCVLVILRSISTPEYGHIMYRGASRRSYKDPRKPIKGEMLAFSRAVLYSRAVSL
jgi:hypothetical protein